MRNVADVAIVGAGPSGMTAALLLARAGNSVTVVERWPRAYPQPRAVGLDHEVRRIFHLAGVDDQIEQIIEVPEDTEAQFVTPDGEVLLSFQLAGRGTSGFPSGAVFHQPDLESLLEQLVVDSPSITLVRDAVATDFEQSPDSVVLRYRHGDGKGKPRADGSGGEVCARYLIGADGANSTIADRMGAEFADLGFSHEWLVVDVRPTVERVWKPSAAQVLDTRRPTTIVPGGPGRRRFEFMLLAEETMPGMATPEATWPLLAKWNVTPDNAVLDRSVAYRFAGRWAKQWRDSRVFVLGDAAHQTPPFLGQGMNSAVRDAANLAGYLNLVLDGRVPDSLLDRYTEERLPQVSEQITMAVRMGEQLCITDPVIGAQRDAMLRQMRGSGVGVPQDTRPPLAAGVLADSDAFAGTLSHQGRIECGGHIGLFDQVCGGGCFVLIALDGDPASGLGPEAARVWSRLRGLSVHVGEQSSCHDIDGTYRNWLGEHNVCVVLVRPDFYVFGSGQSVADSDRLVLELGAKLGIYSSADR